MILDDVFLFLKDAGVARSHAAFSTDFLGHSPRYYDYIRCSGARPSLRSLVKLAFTLTDLAKVASMLSEKVALSDCAERVIGEVYRRCR
ncbi:MAG: hypothetical protein QHC67_16745 [Sphingobium sp.]|uniref:DUF6626 family protein n=1 Tax=Sphingobium sp. TaxID=1912891 RepID=UPI0029AA9851|nr:DUF6626 family protein [Sphingobium sp.]MDX3911437.1 hypothetical protein [Sphingobium sp.]